MHVLFINKFVPPDRAPTAVLIDAVARVVRESGGTVEFAGSHTAYRSKRVTGWRRWLREAYGNFVLLWRGLTGPRPDVIVCLSDPPGCLVTSALVAQWTQAKLVHWAMDVYPEIAVALGELRSGGPVQRMVQAAMRWAYERCAAIACLDDDMMDRLGLREDPRAFVSTPWPPEDLTVPAALPTPGGKRLRWLYSGNLGRAHEYGTLLRAQRRLEDAGAAFELVFQGGGPCWEAAKRLATDLRLEHCQWREYVSEHELIGSLMEARVLVATQKPETRGLLWPSKLAPMLALPRAIAWVGPTSGAVAELVRASGVPHGVFAPGDDEALARWLMDERVAIAATPAALAEEIRARLDRPRSQALELWRVRLDSLATPPGQ